MAATAMTGADLKTQTIARPHPLLSVLSWELRRFRASRLFWIQALCYFGLVLFLIVAAQTPHDFNIASPNHALFNVFVPPTSVWGLLWTLQPGLLLLPGLLLPFVNGDGVTRDLQRRTHEILMANTLPTWAYVWGRYLTGLLMSLELALLTLAAILAMDLLLHVAVSTDPLPPVSATLLLWVGMVVPATILLSSVSFALGTLLPRQSTLTKLGILIVWFFGILMLPGWIAPEKIPAWYSAWDPTSAATAGALLNTYAPSLQSPLASATTAAQAQHILNAVANTMPAIGNWLAPHLIEAGASLLLVALVALTFQRFRNTFDG